MNDHAERRDASLQETLTAIDDAVLDRCVSCHHGLSPDAPSPWWCSPECQQAWSEQQVDNPHEVLDRDDAAQVLVGMDAASVPLREDERGEVHGMTPEEAAFSRWVVGEQWRDDARVMTWLEGLGHTFTEEQAAFLRRTLAGTAVAIGEHGSPPPRGYHGRAGLVPVRDADDAARWDAEREQIRRIWGDRRVSPSTSAIRFEWSPTDDGEVPIAAWVDETRQWMPDDRDREPLHHTHCQHEAACCRCEGHEGCRHIRATPDMITRAIRRLTGSGGT